MSSGHNHSDIESATYTRPLGIAFGLVATYAVVQFLAGIAAGSLALKADAGHMATDALGIGMALAAASIAARAKPTAERSFGLYRVEILAALTNAVLLFGVASFVIVEAIRRLMGTPGEVHASAVIIVAFGGLIINVVAFLLLRKGASESLNIEGAFVEVLGDLLASIGVVVGGIVMLVTGWYAVDAIVGIAIGIFILPRAFSLGRRSVRILLQIAPEDVDVQAMRSALAGLQHVVEVHDLHVWTLTSQMHAATVHIVIRDGAESHATLDAARATLSADFGIDHATFQIEPQSHTGCSEVAW